MKRKLFSILALLLMAATGATAQTTYSVTVKDGTVDADKWTATPNPATAGQTVTVKYTGTKKVKSVKAVKKAKPVATVATAPTATADVKAGSETALVSGGTATGGTMMYKVTTANTKPTSTEGFSATVPTAKTLAAGTFYMWYYVKADDTHTDSEISATPIEVTVEAAQPSETITFSGGSMNYTYQGTNFSVNGEADFNDGFIMLNKFHNMTISAKTGKTITKVVFQYIWNGNLDAMTFSSGEFDGSATVSNVNATSLTVSSTSPAGTHFSGVTIYYNE